MQINTKHNTINITLEGGGDKIPTMITSDKEEYWEFLPDGILEKGISEIRVIEFAGFPKVIPEEESRSIYRMK